MTGGQIALICFVIASSRVLEVASAPAARASDGSRSEQKGDHGILVDPLETGNQGQGLFEMDIVLTEADRQRHRRGVTGQDDRIWPNAIIPYDMPSYISELLHHITHTHTHTHTTHTHTHHTHTHTHTRTHTPHTHTHTHTHFSSVHIQGGVCLCIFEYRSSSPFPSYHIFFLFLFHFVHLGKEGYRLATQAMAHWMNHTCLKFKERENEKDYIKFVEIGGLVDW